MSEANGKRWIVYTTTGELLVCAEEFVVGKQGTVAFYGKNDRCLLCLAAGQWQKIIACDEKRVWIGVQLA